MLVPLVEGHAEVEAVPGLLRRMLAVDDLASVRVARPVRFKRQLIVKEGELERVVAIAARDRPGAAGILLLLDADDDCAAELASRLLGRARRATGLPVSVVVANREFEAWLLAAAGSLARAGRLRGDAEAPSNPEEYRHAKSRLSAFMAEGLRYLPIAHKPAFVEVMDLDEAHANSRSFRKLRQEVRTLGIEAAST